MTPQQLVTFIANAVISKFESKPQLQITLNAGVSASLPSSGITAGYKIRIKVVGDLKTTPATLNFQGHKLLGNAVGNMSYNMNLGMTLTYVNSSFGFAIN